MMRFLLQFLVFVHLFETVQESLLDA